MHSAKWNINITSLPPFLEIFEEEAKDFTNQW